MSSLVWVVDIVNAISQSSSNIGRRDFVEQEIYAALTAFNFTSRIVQETVVQQPTDGLYAYAVNFNTDFLPLSYRGAFF